jgi:hypothetical protein
MGTAEGIAAGLYTLIADGGDGGPRGDPGVARVSPDGALPQLKKGI